MCVCVCVGGGGLCSGDFTYCFDDHRALQSRCLSLVKTLCLHLCVRVVHLLLILQLLVLPLPVLLLGICILVETHISHESFRKVVHLPIHKTQHTHTHTHTQRERESGCIKMHVHAQHVCVSHACVDASMHGRAHSSMTHACAHTSA